MANVAKSLTLPCALIVLIVHNEFIVVGYTIAGIATVWIPTELNGIFSGVYLIQA